MNKAQLKEKAYKKVDRMGESELKIFVEDKLTHKQVYNNKKDNKLLAAINDADNNVNLSPVFNDIDSAKEWLNA
jgi:hypothetical protein